MRDDNHCCAGHVAVMLNLLPAPLHRLALRMAHGLRLWWWRKTRRTVRGCSVIAANSLGHIMLVRHSYHYKDVWMLPGGGLAAKESPQDAAARELAEEVGCTLADARCLGTFTLGRNGWTNLIELVAGTTCDIPRPDGREISAAQFFDPHALPDPTSTPTRQMIALWLDHQNGSSA